VPRGIIPELAPMISAVPLAPLARSRSALPGRASSLLGAGLSCSAAKPQASGDIRSGRITAYHRLSPQHTISKVALGVTCRACGKTLVRAVSYKLVRVQPGEPFVINILRGLNRPDSRSGQVSSSPIRVPNAGLGSNSIFQQHDRALQAIDSVAHRISSKVVVGVRSRSGAPADA
jgi:hypothetical protein